MDREHGYSAYSHGCRCTTCRAAKAQRTRQYRQQASQRRRSHQGGRLYVAVGITHGYAGYVNHQCRCPTCREAKADADRARHTRRKEMTTTP